MSFDRARLPEAVSYFESRGLTLTGRGRWRTTRCDFHGGSDSMRVDVKSGCWVCMNCGAKGGDVLAYEMQVNGADFVTAAKALGAWVDEGRSSPARRPRAFSAADALSAIELELNVCAVVISDAIRGRLPSESDWARFLDAAGRVIAIAAEARR